MMQTKSQKLAEKELIHYLEVQLDGDFVVLLISPKEQPYPVTHTMTREQAVLLADLIQGLLRKKAA